VKVRQSASFVAGVATLCVAASTSVTAVTAAAAATTETKGPVVRSIELTAASDVLVNGVNVAGLPLQNFVTLLNALAGVAGGSAGNGGNGAGSLQALPNLLYSQLVAGTLTPESANTAIGNALGIEQDAFANLVALFGGSTSSMFTANSKSVEPQLNSAAVTQADTGGTVADAINVASLPLQNGITALNALAGVAGGGAGNGGNGAGSLQALPNLLYSQLVAGTLTEASTTAAINAALATEQTALTNLAATPGKIIATDIAAVQKLAGDFGANTLSADKLQTNTLALKNTHVTPSATPKLKTDGSTTPVRHAANANAKNPVSSAIKVIKEASKGSYVGRHRADAIGAKAAAGNGADGSKGSSEK
jgi:hypothetical protein